MATTKEAIEGKPLRCPLHAALVHFPIGLFALGLLLDLLSLAIGRAELALVRAAFIALAAGLATAVLAALAGFVDYTDIRRDHPAKKTATLHMVLNLVAVVFFAISVGLRVDALDSARTPALPLLLSLLAMGVLGYSGYLGGELVYNEGIGVGRHRRRTRTPEQTTEVSPAAGERRVRAGSAADVKPGETARVSIDGTIVVIANFEGRYYAFQEFCTHRYGPLSEGKLEQGRIECPWHRSTFDLATGRVCDGPAKADLRTFPVEERDGELWVTAPEKSRAPEQART